MKRDSNHRRPHPPARPFRDFRQPERDAWLRDWMDVRERARRAGLLPATQALAEMLTNGDSNG